MSSLSTLPYSIKFARFLGSQNKVIVGGESLHAELQILFASEDSSFSEAASFSFPKQKLSSCELCSISRIQKTFLATSTYFPNNGNSSISLVRAETTAKDASLHQHELSSTSSDSIYTDLSFNRDMEYLASVDEVGDLVIWDINYDKEVMRVQGDACGLTSCTFLPSGDILTLGNSSGPHMKVWE